MSDKIIPFKRREPQASAQAVETTSLAEALAHLPEEAPILLQFVVKEPPTN